MNTANSNLEEKFVSKLIKDTRKGEINWKSDKTTILIPSMERITSKIYVTKIKDDTLRLYQYNYRYYHEEDQWDWIPRIRLEMIDENRETLYEFLNNYSLEKLFNAIRENHSGVNDFMKGYIEN